MKRNIFASLTCLVTLTLAGCVYEMDEPQAESSAAANRESVDVQSAKILELFSGKSFEAPYGIRVSIPMPAAGKCSYAAAVKSKTDVQYTVPVKKFAGIGQESGSLHFENGMTVSWSRDTYMKLKEQTPEARDTSASIFQVTRKSFESLISRDDGLRSVIASMGVNLVEPYFVTSHECLSPLGR